MHSETLKCVQSSLGMPWRKVGRKRGIAPLILNLGTGGEWLALRLACFSPIRTEQQAGCVPQPAWTFQRPDLSSRQGSDEAVSCATRWTIPATVGGITIN